MIFYKWQRFLRCDVVGEQLKKNKKHLSKLPDCRSAATLFKIVESRLPYQGKLKLTMFIR